MNIVGKRTSHWTVEAQPVHPYTISRCYRNHWWWSIYISWQYVFNFIYYVNYLLKGRSSRLSLQSSHFPQFWKGYVRVLADGAYG